MAALQTILLLVLCLFIQHTRAQNYQVTFSIEEQLPNNTFIGNVSSSYQFTSDIPREENGHVRFGFLQQNYIQSLLKLDENTGIITTDIVIDRESKNICQSQISCTLKFDVAARSARPQSSYFAIISVTLVIKDINDNAPRFPRSFIDLEISESTIIGTSFPIDSAVDLDSGLFSVQNYKISKLEGRFGLDVVRKLDGSFTVKLILKTPLDREVKDQYKVVIVATDGGSPNKFGALTVNITVTDMNDNAPEFTESIYNITVHENITVGTTILQVTARDRDINLNSQILYRFSQNQLDNRVNDLFMMDKESGELKLKNRLVYESGTSYKIIIEASDRGMQPQVTQAIVTIHVLDVGNNRPSIQINLLNQGNSKIVDISESSIEGTFVAHFTVTDKDTGKNGEVECQISDSKFKLLSMTRQGYKVIVGDQLDRESQEYHQITVTCQDHGQPPLSTSDSFRVHLSDENDTPPKFAKEIFTGSIPENHRPFKTFVHIVAFDGDLGRNGEVRYYIDSESTHYRFVINELTGDLRADQEFDRETVKEVTFRVIARDRGEEPLSKKAIVKLTILDKNDNVPQFFDKTEFNVTENLMSGTFVGQLKATDDDEGKNAEHMFLITKQYELKVPFVLFTDGKIKTNQELDRELQSVYKFEVVVFDQGAPRLSSSANITIRVNDINDNVPYFNFPKIKNDTVVVRTDTKPGSQVAQIDAMDRDEGENTIVSYVILSGNDEDLFVIDNQNGGIYLKKKVTVKQNKTITMKVKVTDGGKPRNSAESAMKIILTNSNVPAYGVNDEEGANNTLIVIIVVILTAVLSLAMIIVICFLRKFDHRSKARKNLDIVAPDEKYPTCYMDEGTPYMDNGNGSHDPMTTYDPMTGLSLNKKKEVSFDIDESVHPNDIRDMQNTTMSTFTPLEAEKVLPPPSPVEDENASRLNQFQLLQYHQAVLESQTRAWLQSHDMTEEGSSFDVTLPDDKCSDTSEEVTASDSGKGGSEDDIPSNHCKDVKSKTLGAPSTKFKTHHYVAPEFRRQGSLQRKACDINFEDLKIHSPKSPVQDELFCRPSSHADVACRPDSRNEVFSRPESRASLAHSTPRPNSRAAMFYPPDYPSNRTLDSAGEPHADWDTASYV